VIAGVVGLFTARIHPEGMSAVLEHERGAWLIVGDGSGDADAFGTIFDVSRLEDLVERPKRKLVRGRAGRLHDADIGERRHFEKNAGHLVLAVEPARDGTGDLDGRVQERFQVFRVGSAGNLGLQIASGHEQVEEHALALPVGEDIGGVHQGANGRAATIQFGPNQLGELGADGRRRRAVMQKGHALGKDLGTEAGPGCALHQDAVAGAEVQAGQGFDVNGSWPVLDKEVDIALFLIGDGALECHGERAGGLGVGEGVDGG